MVAAIRDERTLAELSALLAEGRVEEALSSLEGASTRLGSAATQTFVLAGQDTADVVRRSTGEIVIDFDTVNERAVSAMRENQLRLVREFGQQQRRATREAIVDGIQRGVNPRDQARAFRRSIGLTENQVRAVNNYRRLLENLDAAALSRKLRDGRFDGTLRRAIADERPLTRRQIDRMVDRYYERAVKHRAEVIARTESLRSVHQGSNQMFRQAMDEGVLAPDQLIRTWNTARDERVRSSHATMHGQQRPFDLPFTSGSGASLMFPGDANAGGAETIQCRCVVSTRIATVEELAGSLFVTLIG